MDATATTARPGPRSRDAILQAAFELCGEVGYARLTIEAVAKRAGVGKQTIYRWWGSKGALVLDALNDRTGDRTGIAPPRDFPNTGDVVEDLSRQMKGMAELIVSPEFEPV